MGGRRHRRRLFLGGLILIGLALVWLGLQLNERRADEAATPMDIEWTDGFAYASIAEGRILRLTVDGGEVSSEVLADGLAYPRGLAVTGNTLYVVELGVLPCGPPIPRCKGEQVGPTAEQESATSSQQAPEAFLRFRSSRMASASQPRSSPDSTS